MERPVASWRCSEWEKHYEMESETKKKNERNGECWVQDKARKDHVKASEVARSNQPSLSSDQATVDHLRIMQPWHIFCRNVLQ